MKCAVDLHIHSCLSPCGDELMTPNNIVGMCKLKELDMIAVTDHNTTRNCKAVIEAAAELPITVIPGMEVTTAEEIHVVCLFSTLEGAMEFDSLVHSRLLPVKKGRSPISSTRCDLSLRTTERCRTKAYEERLTKPTRWPIRNCGIRTFRTDV